MMRPIDHLFQNRSALEPERGGNRRWLQAAFALVLALMVVLQPLSVRAQENYPIGPGDVLSVTFLSNSQFNSKAVVGNDGTIFLPFAGGELTVAGRTINQLRKDIPVLMTGSVFRERVNGEELLVSISPEEVSVTLSEYRPIFVDGGAVNSPGGQQPFVVGMNVRQAIAAAKGGIKNQFFSVDGPDIRVREHPQVLMADLVGGVMAELAVQRALLAGGAEDIDTTEIEDLNAPPILIASAIETARSQVQTTNALLEEELAFLQRSVKEAETRVMAALRHEEVMSGIVLSEREEVDQMENLVARGGVRPPSTLLIQARRLYLQAAERYSGVQADRLSAEDSWRELVLKQNQALREGALKYQQRIQELAQRESALRVQIDLSTAGLAELDREGEVLGGAPRITVFRKLGGDQALQIEVTPGTSLLPGDVVHVRFAE